MTPGQDPIAEAAAEIRSRCAALGVVAWSLDETGKILSDPHRDGRAGRWTRAEPLTAAVCDLARRIVASADQVFEPESFAPGAWLVPCVFRHDSGDTLVTIGLTLESGAFDAAGFAMLVDGEAPLQAEELERLTKRARTEVQHLSQVLHWWHADLCRANDAHIVNDGLLQEVDISFERISTLCKVARSMSCLTSPREFVEGACVQLADLLEFRWTAVQYVDSPYELADLGALVLHGDLPCSEAEFSALATATILAWNQDQCTQVHEYGSGMSSALEAPVLIEPITHDGDIIGALFAGGRPERQIDSSDIIMVDTVGDFMGTFHQNAMRFAVQHALFTGTVRALSSAIDAKDAYTRGHSDRVASLAVALAATQDMPDEHRESLYISGLLHDVGKIGVPEAILGKPGSLTPDEYEQIKLHPSIGHDILKGIPTMAEALPGVLHHHERWDGHGYPHELSGEDIPLFGRLLAIPDAFDAMSSDRSYRARLGREEVLEIIRRGAGGQWDPELVQKFLELDFGPYDRMLANHARGESMAA